MFLSSFPNVYYPQSGFRNNNDSFNYYLGVARIVHYDPNSKKADIQWLDGFGGSANSVDVAFMESNRDSFFGIPPSDGDVVLVSRGRGNLSSGFPYIVAKLPISSEATRINAFVYDFFEDRYDFSYTRSPESSDPYLKSKKGSELHLTQDIFLGTSSFSQIEGISSQDIFYNTSRAFHFFGGGIWGNFGTVNLPMAFQKTGDSGDIKSLHKNEYDRQASKSIDSGITPIILEDGTFLYAPTENDSKKNGDESDPYTEFDFMLSETHPLEPVSLGSSDLINEDFLKAGEDTGIFARLGFGTKIGKDPERKDLYSRPVRRAIYSEDSEDQLKFETDKKKLQEGIKTKDDNDKFGTSFWFNLYQKSKEVGFFEVIRSGAIKIFSGVKSESDGGDGDSGNSLELDLKGRVKASIGNFEDYNPDIDECSDDQFPEIKKSSKTESVIGFFKKGINLFIKEKDDNDTAFQIYAEEGHGRLRFGGDFHVHVEGKERRYVKGDGVSTYNGNFLLRATKSLVAKSKKTLGFQGSPLVFALKPSTFTDSCGGGSSSGTSSNVITIGFGSDITDTGEVQGGKQAKATVDSIESPTKLTLDLAGLNEILVQNFTKFVFDGKVDVGKSPKPVGVKGSISSFSGSNDVHTNHTLDQQLSGSLRASGGGSSSGSTGDSGTQRYESVPL